MHAGQGSGGPTAGDDPKWNTNCTFATRFFQTTVFIANKPKFFSAGVAGSFCVQERLPHPHTVRPGYSGLAQT